MKKQSISIIIFQKNNLYPFKKLLLLGITQPPQLHALSQRAEKPFIPINCAAIPASLLESELFGIEAGVASGVQARIGRFEQAAGGSILLDEIGDMLKKQNRRHCLSALALPLLLALCVATAATAGDKSQIKFAPGADNASLKGEIQGMCSPCATARKISGRSSSIS